MVRRALYIMLAMAIASLATVNADNLLMEGLNQAKSTESQRPARGMSMEKVEATWGQPSSKRGAVGDPPISRWEYPNFIVYFEYNHVIHAVQKH